MSMRQQEPHFVRIRRVRPVTGGPARAAATVFLLAALAATARQAAGLINVNFTPIHLVTQSEHILTLEVGPVGPKGEIPVRVVKCLKGKTPAEGLALTCSKGKTPRPQAEALRRAVGKTTKHLGLFFTGKYVEETDQDGAGPPDRGPAEGFDGLLHVQGRWYRLYRKTPAEPWALEKRDDHMEGTWAGGTDMLLRAVNYVLKDPDPIVPTRTGATWGQKVKAAKVTGKVHGAIAVDLAGDGRSAPCLHILCEAGDRLLQWDKKAKAFVDIAAKRKLAAKSRSAAWGDLDADGRLDLACWDGKRLRLWFQAADGTFAQVAVGEAASPKGPCFGLSVLDLPGGKPSAGTTGRPAILVSTYDIPILLRPRGKRSVRLDPLVMPPAGKALSTGLGQARACLVADFDGDRIADVLQPFAKGMMLYKGKQAGTFVPRRRDGLGTGKGRAGAFVGDYDADGLLDVFVAAEESCLLWHNRGGGKFEETLGLAGEAAYISKPNGIGGGTCDINNDGRQDVLILYDNIPPQLFFNRGFRSFGHSHMLDLNEKQLLPQADKGQQAGLVTDLDGDGGQDMALVLANGEVWVFWRDAADAPALGVRAVLAVGGPTAGPITVTGWSEDRCLGAWNVTAGGPGAFFGLFEPGTCKLQWQLPGKKPQEKKLAVEDGAVRFVLRP